MNENRVPIEFRLENQRNRFPWCDTCKLPAVHNEFIGLTHSTPEHRFGVPRGLDTSGHEVTVNGWWDDRDPQVHERLAAHYDTEAAGCNDQEYAAGLRELARACRAMADELRDGAA